MPEPTNWIENEVVAAIRHKLNEIEKEYNIKILFAVESGSRAWGFASPDSDYDVRFVYINKPEWYFRVDKHHSDPKDRDTIEWRSEDKLLDFSGWNLEKTLKLVRAGNPTFMEWTQSPLVYVNDQNVLEDGLYTALDFFKELSFDHYDRKKTVMNYLSIADDVYKIGINSVTVKKLLYATRSLAAAAYACANQTPPPMALSGVIGCLSKEAEACVIKLIATKINNPESRFAFNDGLSSDEMSNINLLIGYLSGLRAKLRLMSESIESNPTKTLDLNQVHHKFICGWS